MQVASSKRPRRTAAQSGPALEEGIRRNSGGGGPDRDIIASVAILAGPLLALLGVLSISVILLMRGRKRTSLYSKVRAERERKAEVIQKLSASQPGLQRSAIFGPSESVPGLAKADDMVLVSKRRHQIELLLSYLSVLVSVIALGLGFLLLTGMRHG